MINIMTFCIFSLLLSTLLMSINFLISKKTWNDREKASPFECGFNPFKNARLPSSIQFFIVSIMFLTFDIEIAIIIPIAPSMLTENISWLSTSVLFLITLIIGLMMEWQESNLTWKS